MHRKRVVLTPEQRTLACREMVNALLERDVEVITFCVGGKHWHGLLRFRIKGKHRSGEERDARRLIRQAKGKGAWAMSKARVIAPGGIWGAKCRVRPIKDRPHQLNVTKYIRDHVKKGAAMILLPKAKPRALALGRTAHS